MVSEWEDRRQKLKERWKESKGKLLIIIKKSSCREAVAERKREGMQSCQRMAGEKSERSGGAKRRRGRHLAAEGRERRGSEREDVKAGHSRWKWVWMEKRRRGCRLMLPHTRQVRRRRKMWFLFSYFLTKGGKKANPCFVFVYFQSKFHRVELFLIF